MHRHVEYFSHYRTDIRAYSAHAHQGSEEDFFSFATSEHSNFLFNHIIQRIAARLTWRSSSERYPEIA